MPTRTIREEDAVHILVERGDRSFYVKQSKKAIVKFLKAKRPKSTRRIRGELWAQRAGKKAGKRWERGVREVQRIAKLPVNGAITYSVDAELAAYWPRDSRGRRILRSRKHAWKAIPGQLTKDVNIRELGCNDGTGYVEGLMRYEGLSKSHAKARARGLARRIQKVRDKNRKPQRVTSAYRSPPYERRIGGAFGAHPRGYAADCPPPPGIRLSAQRVRMRVAFECGIGTYVSSNFIHGDFDPDLGYREWKGN